MSSSDASGTPGTSATNNGPGGSVGGGAMAAAAAAGVDPGRSLLVDEAFFKEQFLRCQVCHEQFDQSERAPKSLPCNHTFCLPCLTQIFDHAQPPARRTLLWADETLDGTLKCPTCRVEIFLSRNKIKELPNDHRVVQMKDFLSQAVAKSQNVCTKHERQPLNFFCKKCLVPVCRDCTVLDHKESEGHNIIDVAEALNENSTQFNEIENKSTQLLQKMKSRSDGLANASKRLDIIERSLRNEIKETFIEYRLLLEKRQEALTNMVQQIIQDQKAKINARFVNVCEHGTQLQKLYDEFKSSKNSHDIRKLFKINQQMSEHEVNFAQVAAESDNDLFQSCEFEAQNEGSFLSDMSGLGEVRPKEDLELKEPVSAHQLVYLDMEEQRERGRYLENSLLAYQNCDEDMVTARTGNVMGTYDSDDYRDPEEEEEEDPTVDWPSHQALMSRLISHYARRTRPPRASEPELMDDGDGTASYGSRRSSALHRRGRRSRDTNSSQVSDSMSHERMDELVLRAARAARAANPDTTPVTPSAFTRASSGSSSSMRHRTSNSSPASAIRVVRHSSSNRRGNAPTFTPDDSN